VARVVVSRIMAVVDTRQSPLTIVPTIAHHNRFV